MNETKQTSIDYISINSSKEEVSEFFLSKIDLSKTNANNLIKESISGDILPYLDDNDYKFLGIKKGKKKRIQIYLNENKDKFKPKPLNLIIDNNSNNSQVKNFFDEYLSFKLNNNDIDGKKILNISEQEMANIGLNLGQRKKLINYINFAKSKINEKKTNLKISRDSTQEEVSQFLKEILKFSDEAIEALDLDGISFFEFTEEDIDEMEELNEEQKENYKNYLKNELKKELSEKKEIKKEKKIEEINEKASFNEDNFEKPKNDGNKEKNKNENYENNLENKKEKLEKEINKKVKEKEEKKEENIQQIKKEKKISINETKNEQVNNQINNNNKKINEIIINKNKKDNKIEIPIISQNNLKDEEKNINNNIIIKNEPQKNIEIKNDKKNEIININNKNIKDEKENKNTQQSLKHNNDLPNKSIKGSNINFDEKKSSKNEKNDEENKRAKDIKIIKKEYKGINSSNIRNNKIYNYNICPIIKDSKFNIFFILIIHEKNIRDSYISIYEDESKFYSFSSNYTNYMPYFINEENKKQNYESIKYIMVQVPIKKDVKKLTINFGIKISYNYYNSYESNIEIGKGIENYFFIDNLNYYSYFSYYKNYPTLNNNEIFKYFLNYFFNKKTNEDLYLQISLIKALINKINNIRNEIELEADIILRFFKLCLYFKLAPKNINSIKIIYQKNFVLSKEYYLTNQDINIFNISKKEKIELISLIVNIYAIYNNEFLMELILSEDGKKYCEVLFDLLKEKKVKIIDLKFKNQDNIIELQKNLIEICKTKKDINNVIKLSKGFTDSLKLIIQNYKTIYSILNEDKTYYYFSNKSLSLQKLENDDKIENIIDLLKQYFQIRNKKDIYIINFEEIFDDLMTLYSNKSLNELCNLKKILELFQLYNLEIHNIFKFYNKIHEKGIRLIKNKSLNIEEIIYFIYKQDIYYHDPEYKNDELRDPIIFKYINITELDENYIINIEIMKKNKIWKLFEDSTNRMREKFYESFLYQIKKMKDIKSIFDLFSFENINEDFNKLINKKVDDVYLTVLDEQEKDYNMLFEIFKNLLICSEKNKLKPKVYILNYDFTSKFFFYLLKNKKLQIIVNKIKQIIIDFFLQQNRKGKANEESLISLLQLSPNNDFCLKLLNQMDNMILKEDDFYQKEENKNFILFKIFFEKCVNLIKNKEILDGKYLNESLLLKSKILNDLSKNKLKYDLINNLIDDDNLFYNNKILVIFDKDKQKALNVYNKIKENLHNCKVKFAIFETIEEYYNTFFKTTKERIINIINRKLYELKQKNLDEILKLDDNDVIVDDEFILDESIKDSENIKYKYSLFFMSIYTEKNNNENFEKTEKEIFDESKKDFEDAIIRIINQKETKEPFFDINCINEIMKVIYNQNDNLEEEIEFIVKEFAHLGKEDYIKNNLLDDLINFSKKDRIQRLIEGIIYFIEAYNKISKFQETEFLGNLRNEFEILNSKGVNGDEIKESIKLLESINYDINKETSLIKFYELFLGK